MGAAIKWGLSVLDWHSHAIDERGDHPKGVYKAECGHLLMMVVALHDEPNGPPCKECAAIQLEVAQAALGRAGAGLQLARTVREPDSGSSGAPTSRPN